MEMDKEVEAFVERIGKRLSESPGASHSGRHRAAFIALRPLIEGALAHGFTIKATWAALREEKKLSMSYQTFRTHCRRAGIRPTAQDAALLTDVPSQAPRPVSAMPAQPSATSPSDAPHRGFRHERVPRKEDIYG